MAIERGVKAKPKRKPPKPTFAWGIKNKHNGVVWPFATYYKRDVPLIPGEKCSVVRVRIVEDKPRKGKRTRARNDTGWNAG